MIVKSSKRTSDGFTIRLLKFASRADLVDYLRSQGVKFTKKQK